MRALVVLVMVASAEVLASQCASPAPFVLPRTTVEEGGLLYVFLPTNYRREPEQEHVFDPKNPELKDVIPSIDAPAFRVKWDDKTFILPGRDGSFARLDDEVPELALRLGHANCHGDNIKWAKKTKFTITALLADGSEVAATPVTLEPPKQLSR